MLIFIYGPDTYRSRQKLREIIEEYRKKHRSGLNLKIFDLESDKISFRDFKNIFRQNPMFEEKKLIVLKNAIQNPDFKQGLLNRKKTIKQADAVTVFWEGSKVLEGDSLVRFLKKNARCQKFEMLSGPGLRSWLVKELDGRGIRADEAALDSLIGFVGSDLWRLNNEVGKLSSFKNKGVLKDNDIKLLVKPKPEGEIFKTIDTLAQKNKAKALRMIEKHLEKGDTPHYLLAMLAFQFRNILLVKLRGPYRSGLKPYPAQKAFRAGRLFSLEELKKIHRRIFETDLNIKTGKISPEEGLKMLIAEL